MQARARSSMDRASDYGSEGWGFNSLRARHHHMGHPAAVQELKARLAGARAVAVLTGAGGSADSGGPTFRGADGLWRTHRAEDLATPEAFARDPRLAWERDNCGRESHVSRRPLGRGAARHRHVVDPVPGSVLRFTRQGGRRLRRGGQSRPYPEHADRGRRDPGPRERHRARAALTQAPCTGCRPRSRVAYPIEYGIMRNQMLRRANLQFLFERGAEAPELLIVGIEPRANVVQLVITN